MTSASLARFQFGDSSSIRAAAQNRNSLWIGLLLVLLTAVARNYDQMHFSESPMWLLGPLVFSFFSGSFLFIVLYDVFLRRSFEPPYLNPHSIPGNISAETPSNEKPGISRFAQWRTFMGLFWLTAPIAWLYAFPAERPFPSYQAAIVNLTLLAIVSLWRVLLMARIISVLQQIPFLRALGWVLVPATLEVMLVIFLGGVFSPTFGKEIMAGMGGMRNAPEESLMVAALGNVLVGALILFALVVGTLLGKRYSGFTRPFPSQSRGPVPILALALLTLAWITIAVPTQREQFRFIAHARLVKAGQYRESLDYLAAHSHDDFPPSRRLEPNPYEYRVWDQLPAVISELKSTDPAWVRKLYLDYLLATFSHYHLRGTVSDWAKMFETIETLPEGKEWAARNREKLKLFADRMENLEPSPPEKQMQADQKRLHDSLQRLGIQLDEIPKRNP